MSVFHKVSKKPEGKCELKNHFSGGAYQVVGILDLWAKNDPERFVCPRVDKIVAACKKFQTSESYGKRWLEKILRELRAHHVISRRLVRVRNYREMKGFIVAPHEALTERKPARKGKTVCLFLGQRWEDGCWKKEIVEDTSAEGRCVTKVRAAHWVAPGAKPVSKPDAGPVSKPVAKPVSKPVSNSVTTLQHGSDTQRVSDDFRSEPIELSKSCEPEELIQPTEPIEPASSSSQDTAEKSNGQTNPKSETENQVCSSLSLTTPDQNKNQETIAQHFGKGRVDMDEITDGLFEETEQSEHFDEIEISTLLQICDDVIKDWGTRRYLGRKTHGDIMGEAMARFTKKYNENVPLYWYPLVKQLRNSKSAQQPQQRSALLDLLGSNANTIEDYSKSVTRSVREFASELYDRKYAAETGLIAKLLREQNLISSDSDWETNKGKECSAWIQTYAAAPLTEQQARDLLREHCLTLPKPLKNLLLWFNFNWKP